MIALYKGGKSYIFCMARNAKIWMFLTLLKGENTMSEMKEKDLSVLVSDYAIENFKNGLNCSESVYEALQRIGALDNVSKDTLALAVGFGRWSWKHQVLVYVARLRQELWQMAQSMGEKIRNRWMRLYE